jgi:hypothetical protein
MDLLTLEELHAALGMLIAEMKKPEEEQNQEKIGLAFYKMVQSLSNFQTPQ